MTMCIEEHTIRQVQRYADECHMESKACAADAQDQEREVVAEIAWNLSTLLSCQTDFVVQAMQELWDKLPHVVAVQTDNLPELTMLHRNRALSLAAAFNIMMEKRTSSLEDGFGASDASSASSASSLAAVATHHISTAEVENQGFSTVLKNLTALQMFHVRRAQALNSEFKARQMCTGWL